MAGCTHSATWSTEYSGLPAEVLHRSVLHVRPVVVQLDPLHVLPQGPGAGVVLGVEVVVGRVVTAMLDRNAAGLLGLT